jgi:cytochrome c-type biogenesis protein CcmF
MIAETGHYALVLALALALIQSTLPLLGARWRDPALMNVARSAALAQLLFVAASFAALVTLHVTSDFSVVNVFENSHSLKPMIYKITGVWGNHEGSMLLWVLILALFGGLVAAFGNNLPLSLRAHVLAVQAWIASAFYLFILITSNPFLRIADPPIEGRDLNPVLQDIGLAVHPPMLYLGYVGFSISFSFAVAALLEGRIDAAWARWVRPWTLMAWIFLTLGIAMGSYWAYYELGWGGWWFWDPVENASLMPWLAGTALLHSLVVMEKRNALKVWTILLSILAFSLSLLGTFLVRSGVLTSVHAFATDALCLARLGAEAGRPVRTDLARRRAGAQQSVPHHRLRDRVHRNAVSAGAGSHHRRQDFGRRAVFQSHLWAAVPAVADRSAVRAAAGVEAR